MRARYVASERRRNNYRRTSCCDVDEAVVERLIAGDRRVDANWYELDAAIVRLKRQGMCGTEASRRLGITAETVWRHDRRRPFLVSGIDTDTGRIQGVIRTVSATATNSDRDLGRSCEEQPLSHNMSDRSDRLDGRD